MPNWICNKLANASYFCACLVVAIHVPCGSSFLLDRIFLALVANFVSFVAVPFFFVCSGYYLSRHVGQLNWWQHAVWRRVNTLVVPYVVWCLLYQILFEQKVNFVCMVDILKYPPLPPFWYMRTLFLFVVTSPLIVILLKKVGWWFVGFIAIVYIVFFSFFQFLEWICLLQLGIGSFYFMVVHCR